LRDRLADLLRAGTELPHRVPSVQELKRMMEVYVGEPVDDAYVTMLVDDMGLAPGGPWWNIAPMKVPAGFKAAIVGAGASAICAAITLKRAGIPFVMFDRNDRVGGTWEENRYPGCGVDTPNHFYSYSFELNAGWSRYFAKRDELRDYLDHCLEKHGIGASLRLGSEVTSVEWDAGRNRWTLTVRGRNGDIETVEANAVISAVGLFSEPSLPAIPGIDGFQGAILHSARWNSDGTDWKGRRVAVVGTGASAVQLAPAIAGDVEHMTVFQRSAPWIVARQNYMREVSDGAKWLMEALPHFKSWYRFMLFWAYGDGIHTTLKVDPEWKQPGSVSALNEQARQTFEAYIRDQIGDDPDLLAKVIPAYPPYGKRVLLDCGWYRTLKRENVDLVTEPIRRILPHGIETADGKTYPVEALILATGFDARNMLASIEVRGQNGVSLRDIWGREDARAHLGIGVPGFPNFFILYGPNTNYAHGGSMIFNAECQTKYVLGCLEYLFESGGDALDCSQAAYDGYNDRIDELLKDMVWSHGSVKNWMTNAKGRVVTNSPWKLLDYWKLTKEVKTEDWKVLRG
jgi:4-hydroxyacetophenone monooxygenase